VTPYLQTVQAALNRAAEITTHYYPRNLAVDRKADHSPVTVADREAEAAIIDCIREKYPDHRFYGEETGLTGPQSDFTWIIDPIDGTKNFIDGIPLWGTLVALMHDSEIILGASDMPLLHERLLAEEGKGAFCNGDRIQVSDRTTIAEAMVSCGSLIPFRADGLERNLLSLLYDSRRHRSFGDLWPFNLLAQGKLEIVVQASIRQVDIAPFFCIIKEAGGMVTDLHGKGFSFDIDSVLATNGTVHKESLAYFNE
jgi:histidinol-phosphatase